MTVMRMDMILRHRLIRSVSMDKASSSPMPIDSMLVRISASVASMSMLVLPLITPAAPATTF